ncbi:MAG: amino acid adenylation domain-containing protein, partial [Acidobacteriota bacterium]
METVTEFLNKLAVKGVRLSTDAGRLNCYAPPGMLTTDLKDGIVHFKSEIIALLEGAPHGWVERDRTPVAALAGANTEGGIIDVCLHERFEEQVALHADRTAVISSDGQLTYRELGERSLELAAYLQSEGVGPDERVGLCMERSLDVIVGLWGVLRAGGAYAPLDPDYPDDRLAYMLADSGASIVLTQERLRDRLRAITPAGTRIVTLDGQWPEIRAHAAQMNATGAVLRRDVKPHHLAYVMYTSGSTGRPKGVMVEHRHIVRYVTAIEKKLEFPEGASYALVSTFAADLGNTVLFPALLGGGTLHVFGREASTDADHYAAYCMAHRIDCMKITPSHLLALLGDGEDPRLIPSHTLILGGEVLPRTLMDRVRELRPECRVFNHYGPTECSVGVLCGEHEGNGSSSRAIPLGRPLDGTRIYILDEQGQPVPIGVAGELWIGGGQVTRGYLNQPVLTAERFVRDRFRADEDDARMYRTGDLARWLDDGTVEYLGRNDFQVKIRGFRIELGEIEAQLVAHARVKEAVVLAREDEPGEKRLVAYVTTSGMAPEVEELRAHMVASVPQYMVPSAFVLLEALPLTPNGKIDRRALPRPEAEAYARSLYEAPRGEIEETLATLWQDLLHVERVGRHDDFFELGGHSLLATRLISKIRGRLNVDLPLKTLFEQTTIAAFAELIAGASQNDIPPICPIDRSHYERLPLSFAQERLWFFDQLEPGNAVYNLPKAVTIKGELAIDVLEEAFQRIIVRHENLRTVFPRVDGQPRQRILERIDFRLKRVDLSDENREERERKTTELCRLEAQTSFDLAGGPLLRGCVIRLDAREHILLLNMHHIISDGWSTGLLIHELGRIMDALEQGQEPELATLPVQYVDYSVWQRTWLDESGILEKQLAYWRKILADLPESLDLVPDYPRPAARSYAGATHAFTLDAQLAGELRSLAQREGGTLYMALLAAFNVLLYRYTGQSDLCVGSPIANRQYGETDGLIGMFINTLALRTQVEGGDDFAALFARVRSTCLEAYEHQDTPFDKVVDLLRLQRNLAITPIFQVMMVLQNAAEVGEANDRFPLYPVETGISKFDLTATFTEGKEGLAGSIEYSTALYRPQTIARICEHFVALCRAIVNAPHCAIRDLGYLGESEKQRLLAGSDEPTTAEVIEVCLHERFEEQVALHADRTAVISSDGQLTYRELGERSLELAAYLQSEGVGPDERVGLCMERSLDVIVGLWGVLRAGGAYAPLDPDYPDDRLAYMLADSGASIVLTQERLRDRLRAITPAGTRIVTLDGQWPEIRAHAAQMNATGAVLRRDVKPHHLAYVMYTSGSTGRPKGVMVEHRHIVRYVTAIEKKLEFPEGASYALVSTFAADLGNTVLFPALLGGGTLHVLGREASTDADHYAAYCMAHRIDCMKITPSHLLALLGDGEDPRLIPSHTLILGGEVLPRTLLDRVRELRPECRVFNHYGPTECSVGVLCGEHEGNGSSSRAIPLGRPLDGTRIYILDEQGQPVPIGVAGELWIGGGQVTRGYLNQPVLTAERFVRDRFRADEDDARMYRTGDLARWLDDGTVEYLGRNDFQVKIRGFRIELGEIEAQLVAHARVKEAVVLAREDEPGEKRLVAYVTTSGMAPEVEELRAHMVASVPQYMVPSAFVLLEALPLTPNGKIDRRALPRPEAEAYARSLYEAPRGEIEETLATLWQDLLHVERVGRHDDFFELGGHSLLATRLISKIRGRLNVDLPLKTLFEQTTIAAFAELIAGASQNDIPPIRPIDRSRYERLPLSFAQERLWFFDQLEPGNAVYNVPRVITLSGVLEISQLDQAFNLIMERHEILRTCFPSDEGIARQEIQAHLHFQLERVDLRHYTGEARHAKVQELCGAEAVRPFDLARGPLFRGKVLKLTEYEHILILTMHHIVSDGWSLGVLIKELGLILDALREGRQPELAPLPIQYSDYSIWQRNWLDEGGKLQRQLGYWEEKLAGAPESLDLVTDHPRPNAQTFAGATHAFRIEVPLAEKIKSLAQREGGTLYMALLAAFNVLLHRYTGQGDLCVGSPIANRQYGETEDLIGMFANTVALRTRIEGHQSFTELLAQVKDTCLEAYEHQDAPFEKVVDILRPQRNLAMSPIFQVMFILQNADLGRLDPRFPRLLLDSVVSKFDLTAAFTETPDGLDGLIEYSTALYRPQTIERMAEHFQALCRAIVAAPHAKIRDLDYLSAAEKRRLLVEYNATRAEYPQDECLQDGFVRQAALHGEKIALVCGKERLTYQELLDRSQTLALYLQGQGVGPDRLVGLCMERTPDVIVGALGILQAGGAYVPLDPEYPDDRLTHMLRDSQAAIVLTQESLGEKLSSLMPAGTQLIAVDRQWPEIREQVAELQRSGLSLRREVGPHDLAYVIYTSGSTGVPKGVAIEHHSPVTLVHWASDVYSHEELAGVLASTSVCFDLSVYEIFVTLANGGTIILVPNALGLIDLDHRESVTLINTVPSAMEELVRAGAVPDSVLTINLAGEPLSTSLVDRIYNTTSARKVYDLYGPSEDTTYSTYVLREPNASPTIGRPIANTQVYILDRANHSQPIGVAGELHIAGDGLARGYLNRRELTEERFVPNPFEPGTRMYKTGDLARWLDDGTIQYLGRIDTQVKVRGFRIELGEVEARLQQHPEIQDSAVVAQGQDGERQLVAFYRAKGSEAGQLVELAYEELRSHLLKTLPDYMVPAAFVSLEAIPLNPNGKVDRRALARMDVTIASGQAYVGPRNDTEKQLVAIWAEVLRLAPETIGIHDNFFELGGHSLLATQLVAKIRSRLNVELALKVLFERSTVARLGEVCAKAEGVDAALAGDGRQQGQEDRHSLLAAQLMARIRGRADLDSSLKALLEQTSVAELAQMMADAETSVPVPAEAEPSPSAIRPVDRSRGERLPLSFAQERLWFVHELEPDGSIYNVPIAVTLHGDLDLSQLDQAFQWIIARHENLRTIFPSREGQAEQRILENLDFTLARTDLSHYENLQARDERARELCQAETAVPFDLSRGPLLRGRVIKLEAQQHILLLNMHHIISDGWSQGILIRELGLVMEALREGRRPELAPLPIQYADYSVWQRTWLEQSGTLEKQLAYWQKKLTGAPETLDLVTDFSRPRVQSFAGATYSFALDTQLSRQLKSLAQIQGGTLFMILLAAFKTLLHRYTGQDDICVGTPIANRQHAETEGLIGMFVNTLALRSQVKDDEAFSNLLAQVKTTCLEAYEHQDTPFERVVDILHPQRNLAITPIFQIMVILQNADLGTLDQRFPRYPMDSGISKFDLTASFTETAQGLTGSLEYSTALYRPQTIERMAEHFQALCRAIVAAPHAKVRDLEYLSAAEKRRLLVEYNATRAEYPNDECLQDGFVRQAALHGEKIALVCGKERLTYQELFDRSQTLALYLQGQGVGPDRLVGLCMERTPDVIVGALGILQAGGAYVPLDP